ncbi:MAG TPA: hypothetical protein VFY40_13615 [Blastocatellia bacterium]|nr:hypothetical protein [Blastocatellia bacterium]
MQPAPEADRARLLRRVSLDLTGVLRQNLINLQSQ